MHDALAFANLLYAMPATTSQEVTKIFEVYQKERYPAVMESFKNSQQMSMIADKSIAGSIFFYLIHNMPFWLWRLVVSCLFGLCCVFSSFVLLYVLAISK
jgi:hypothetical protein